MIQGGLSEAIRRTSAFLRWTKTCTQICRHTKEDCVPPNTSRQQNKSVEYDVMDWVGEHLNCVNLHKLLPANADKERGAREHRDDRLTQLSEMVGASHAPFAPFVLQPAGVFLSVI